MGVSEQHVTRQHENYRICSALIRLITLNGGEMTFTRVDFSAEAFAYLAQLEDEGYIELVANVVVNEPKMKGQIIVERVYRLKEHSRVAHKIPPPSSQELAA